MPKAGSRQERGYGKDHDAQRKAWEPRVKRGGVHCHEVVCLMPSRLILAGQAWDVLHNEDGTKWIGPGHAKCNRSEGAKRGAARRSNGLRHSRAW